MIGKEAKPQACRDVVADLGLSIVPQSPVRMGGVPIVDPVLRGIPDADRECAHGRLPTDHSPPCGCWGELEQRIVIQRLESKMEASPGITAPPAPPAPADNGDDGARKETKPRRRGRKPGPKPGSKRRKAAAKPQTAATGDTVSRVLGDLKAERARLDAAIKAIEAAVR